MTFEPTGRSSLDPVRISEVAARSGIPATTLRYYDSIGLLDARRDPNGYRIYDDDVFDRLTFVEAAKQLDLSLPEISELVRVVEGDTCTEVRDALYPKLTERLRAVDTHLANLRLLRSRLIAATRRVAACPDSPTSCRSECLARIEGRTTCDPDDASTHRPRLA